MSSANGRAVNVLLVVFDSVRAANTSLHGHHNRTTPFLESFAEGATVYRQARAPGTESISSHTSIFTGLTVREHGITHRRCRLKPGYSIWEELSNAGYETAVFSNNPFLTELPVGLVDVFDTVVGQTQEQPYPEAVNPKQFILDAADHGPRKYLQFFRTALSNGHLLKSLANGVSFKFRGSKRPFVASFLRPDSSAKVYTDRFLDWQRAQDGPWAACVNFMDAHYPYEPDPEFDQWGGERIRDIQRRIDDQAWEFVAGDRPWGERRAIEALYDGAIRQMDHSLERLIGVLDERGVLEETLVVVTGDHGEGFGERSRVRPEARIVGHGNGGLHESVLHVPLVVKYPGQTRGDESHQVVSLTAFPDAVAAARAGKGDVETVHPTGEYILSSTDGVDPDTVKKARAYCDSISPYDVGADAVYRQTDGPLRKQIRWGDRSATIRIADAQAAWKESDDAGDVTAVVERLRDADVRVGTADDVDAAVVERLEDLGYA